MKANDRMLKHVITGLLATAGIAAAGVSNADAPAMEQCAGVVKAASNDCATSSNACHSHVTVDSSPEAWVYLPKGTCARIAGAHLVKVDDPTPKK